MPKSELPRVAPGWYRSMFGKHMPSDAVQACLDVRCKLNGCQGWCRQPPATQREAARNWAVIGAKVRIDYHSSYDGSAAGRDGTIVEIGDSTLFPFVVEIPPDGRWRKARRIVCNLDQIAPFEPDAPGLPVLNAEQIEALALIDADPMAPRFWNGRQWLLALLVLGYGLVAHAPGRRMFREPWMITERGRRALENKLAANHDEQTGLTAHQ